MIEELKELCDLAIALGLSPAVVVALITVFLFYRMLIEKNKVIEKMSEALSTNTTVLVEIKTLLNALL